MNYGINNQNFQINNFEYNNFEYNNFEYNNIEYINFQYKSFANKSIEIQIESSLNSKNWIQNFEYQKVSIQNSDSEFFSTKI